MNQENGNDILSQRALQALVEEARTATPGVANVDIDWDRVDASLFARVEREAAEVRALAAHRGRPGAWLLLGGVAAAAAAVAVFAQPAEHQAAPLSRVAVMSSAGDLTLQKGAGEIFVDGVKARAGAHARAGDTIGTRGAKAVFEAPGRVSWLLEDESNVTVEPTGGPVVLALRQGALEAQVAPVASGEAFAVDVDGIRVAVHGTHLRVAREGDHVVVDLTEGVVSIGAPPKSGSTYGTLVTAPAHVEFHSDALAGSLTVDHASHSVRKAADLDSVMDEEPSASVTPPSRPADPRADDHIAPTPPRGAVAPQVARNVATPNPEDAVASAVRACAAAQPHTSLNLTEVRATFTGMLVVDVDQERHVTAAKFDPPVQPDSIHSCASPKIYEPKLFAPGHYEIPISFQAP
jgi:FecR protein